MKKFHLRFWIWLTRTQTPIWYHYVQNVSKTLRYALKMLSLATPPENIRKLEVLLCFQGVERSFHEFLSHCTVREKNYLGFYITISGLNGFVFSENISRDTMESIFGNWFCVNYCSICFMNPTIREKVGKWGIETMLSNIKKNKARSLVFLTFFEVCGVQYTTLMQYILGLEISAFKF